MQEKLIQKVGYVSIYEIKDKNITKYKIDSGKTITIQRLNKTVINKNRILKEYKTKAGDDFLNKDFPDYIVVEHRIGNQTNTENNHNKFFSLELLNFSFFKICNPSIST